MASLVFRVTDIFENKDSLWLTTDKPGSNGHLGGMVIELKTPDGNSIKRKSRVLHANRGLDAKDYNYMISIDKRSGEERILTKADVPLGTEIWLPIN